MFKSEEKVSEEMKKLLDEYERVDYSLPVYSEFIINEYLSSGDVHLKYWANAEVCSFILEKLQLISAEKEK